MQDPEQEPILTKEAVEIKPNKPDDPRYSDLPLSRKFKMFKKIILGALPLFITIQTFPITGIVNINFLRGYGNESMVGGYGLAVTLTTILILSFMTGFNQGFNILISIAQGRKQYRLCGVYLQRELIIFFFWLIPLFLIMFYIEHFLRLIGVEEAVIPYTQEYTRYSLPAFVIYSSFEVLKSFVISHKIFNPIFYIQLFTLIIHPFWSWLFISYFQLGIKGASCALLCETVSNVTIIIIYIKRSDKFNESFIPWSWKHITFDALWKQSNYVASVALSTICEFACFEIMCLIGATFGVSDVVVNSSLHEFSAVVFSTFTTISITSMVMIGNNLGKSRPEKAHNYAFSCLVVNSTVAVFLMTIAYFLMEFWESYWSDDPETKAKIGKTLLVFILTVLPLDAIANSFMFILKTVGKQNTVSLTVVLCYLLVTIPMGIYLGVYQGFNVLGVWISFSFGNIFMIVTMIIVFRSVNWKERAEILNISLDKQLNIEEEGQDDRDDVDKL